MVYSLTYRRPPLVRAPDSKDSLSDEEKQRAIHDSIKSGCSAMSHGIPEALSFDRIVAGGTCPPCTIRDFMNYLKYIEHDAENLQFYLWFQDYSNRWEQLTESQKELAQPWDLSRAEAEATSPITKRPATADGTAVLRDAAVDENPPSVDLVAPFNAPHMSLDEKRASPVKPRSSSGGNRSTTSRPHESIAEHSFHDAGMEWQPFSNQPYREEVARIISIYLAEGAPRELNLSAKERQAVLHAVQHTTHPSAFKYIVTTVEYSLRRQSHPNFIRWAICNGNRARVIFAKVLGLAGIVCGVVADLLITLSRVPRAYRVIPLVFWFIGFATVIAAWKGMCVVLHGLHHRHLRPWELFSDQPDEIDEKLQSDSEANDSQDESPTRSHEDEPWVAKYDRRNFMAKIFDREVWVQEPALRQIQDTIFLQSVLGGFFLSCVTVGIFCAVPNGIFF